MQEIEADYDVVINDFSVARGDNVAYLITLMDAYEVPVRDRGRVPITFIQDEYFIGFGPIIARDIKAILTGAERERRTENIIDVPLLGDIDLSSYSLPALAITLGFVDGFNVCSIGALIFILSIVIGLGSRSRIIIIGSAFIIAVVAAYWLLIFLWYQFFTILQQYFSYVNVLVGLIALGGGIYYFRQFLRFKKYGPVCDTSQGSILRKARQGIRQVVKTPKSMFSLVAAVMGFAVLVTLIEFPCSAGIPAAFTGVLALADLPTLTYLWYITLYTFFYMLVEIVVFVTAVVSAKIWLANAKFVTWSTFVGAMVLMGLGVYYLSLVF
ncbi:MAG: hypothetical protein JJU48_02780 [Methylophaga sp.]|nr:hypothetical protein [Methylophaga sp.]